MRRNLASPCVSLFWLAHRLAQKPASVQWKDWPCGSAVWLGFVGVVALVGRAETRGCGAGGSLLLQHD